MAKDALDFFAPAKRDSSARMVLGDDVVIPREVLNEIPHREFADLMDEEGDRTELRRNVLINIRATDLDNPDRNWRVVIPEVFERRLRFIIDPTINLSELYHRQTFHGDVMLVYRRTPEGTERPIIAHLLKIYSEQSAPPPPPKKPGRDIQM